MGYIIKHSCGKSPSLNGKSTISMVIFQFAMFNYQRVIGTMMIDSGSFWLLSETNPHILVRTVYVYDVYVSTVCTGCIVRYNGSYTVLFGSFDIALTKMDDLPLKTGYCFTAMLNYKRIMKGIKVCWGQSWSIFTSMGDNYPPVLEVAYCYMNSIIYYLDYVNIWYIYIYTYPF